MCGIRKQCSHCIIFTSQRLAKNHQDLKHLQYRGIYFELLNYYILSSFVKMSQWTSLKLCLTFHRLTQVADWDSCCTDVADLQALAIKAPLNCLSLHFNGHFPGEPVLAGVYWSKGWWRWWWQLDYWSYKSFKAPVISSPLTNQRPVFTARRRYA